MTTSPSTPYFVVVRGIASEAEDDAVAGIYELAVPEGFPADAAVTAVLDEFHARIGIAVLDDFQIVVTDADGTELFEGDDEGKPARLPGRAVFFGRVGDAEPLALQA